MKYGVPQGSVLGPLLFLIYINDLHNAIKNSTVHHFADDTNLLVSGLCIKKIQDQINLDLKYLSNWLKANKITLNASKTELIIFRQRNKHILYRKNPDDNLEPWKLNIKIDGKKIEPSTHVKYLGVLLDSHLEWNYHVDELSTKLSRAVGMLAKIRHYVSKETLNMIYYGIFSSLLHYGSQNWGQSDNVISKMEKLQNKALRVMNFESPRASANPLYNKCEILKFGDQIKLSNFLFAHDSLKRNLPSVLCDTVSLVNLERNQSCRNQFRHQVNVPSVRTVTGGSNSIKSKSARAWNDFNKIFVDKQLIHKSRPFCNDLIKSSYIHSYVQLQGSRF